MFDLTPLLFVVGYALIFLGIVGALVPVLPGPLLIWLGAFVWAWADGFDHIGWPTLLVLAVLTIIAWAADLGLSLFSSRRSGAGWRSIFVSILGGLAGAIVLSSVPVIGTFIGAVVGSIAALWVMEFRRAQLSAASATGAGAGDERTGEATARANRAAATQAVKGYVSGFFLAMAVEFVVSVIMLSIFAWQAFL